MNLSDFEKNLSQFRVLLDSYPSKIIKIDIINKRIHYNSGTVVYSPKNKIINLFSEQLFIEGIGFISISFIDLTKESNQVIYKTVEFENINYISDINLFKKFMILQSLYEKGIENINIPKLDMAVKRSALFSSSLTSSTSGNSGSMDNFLVKTIKNYIISDSNISDKLAVEIFNSIMENSSSNITLNDLLLKIANITFIFSEDMYPIFFDIAKSYFSIFSNLNILNPQTIINYTLEQRLPEIFLSETITAETKGKIKEYIQKYINNYKLDLYIKLLQHLKFPIKIDYLDLYYNDKLYIQDKLDSQFISKTILPTDLYYLCKHNKDLLLFNNDNQDGYSNVYFNNLRQVSLEYDGQFFDFEILDSISINITISNDVVPGSMGYLHYVSDMNFTIKDIPNSHNENNDFNLNNLRIKVPYIIDLYSEIFGEEIVDNTRNIQEVDNFNEGDELIGIDNCKYKCAVIYSQEFGDSKVWTKDDCDEGKYVNNFTLDNIKFGNPIRNDVDSYFFLEIKNKSLIVTSTDDISLNQFSNLSYTIDHSGINKDTNIVTFRSGWKIINPLKFEDIIYFKNEDASISCYVLSQIKYELANIGIQQFCNKYYNDHSDSCVSFLSSLIREDIPKQVTTSPISGLEEEGVEETDEYKFLEFLSSQIKEDVKQIQDKRLSFSFETPSEVYKENTDETNFIEIEPEQIVTPAEIVTNHIEEKSAEIVTPIEIEEPKLEAKIIKITESKSDNKVCKHCGITGNIRLVVNIFNKKNEKFPICISCLELIKYSNL